MKKQTIITYKNINEVEDEKQAISEALNYAKHDNLTLLTNRVFFMRSWGR
jgi:hypothetical protein